MNQRLFFGALASAFVLWAICAVLNVGGQRSLFMDGDNVLLCDYWIPWPCA